MNWLPVFLEENQTMKFRTIVGLSAVAVLSATLMSAPQQANSAYSVPVLATGHVTFPAGATSGQVLVFASPDQQTEALDTAGVIDPTPLVASVNVGADGNFTVATDPTSLPASVTSSEGLVNMEAISVAGGQALSYFFPATPQGSVWTSTTTGSPVTPTIAFDMSTGVASSLAKVTSATRIGKVPVSATKSSMSPAPKSLLKLAAGTGRITSARMALATTTDAAAPCGLIPLTPDSIHGEHFTSVYDDGAADAHIAEGVSSDHTLGIAVESSSGGFTAGGTATISRSSSTKWVSKDRQHSWGYYNKVWYRPYRDTCRHIVVYRPLKFYDIGSADIDGSVLYDFQNASCSEKNNTETWDTTSATAASFSTGIHVQGVGLYVQSGYSTDVNQHFKMLQHGSIRGSNPSGVLYSAKLSAAVFNC